MTEFLDNLKERNPGETEFLQAVEEFYKSAKLVLDKKAEYRKMRIMDRMSEPERVIIFNVPWIDEDENVQINRGFRVQMNSALGPYKGGLRFHPSVNLSILKFLAFEQISKNALTTLPLGAGKGGSDFDPKGKSEFEIMRFCQSFMNELFRHIGDDTDIPAGDIGVGSREIGYLFGKYKKIRNEFNGVLTGKGINWGGSLIRPEATGYGVVYFAEDMLNEKGKDLEDLVCLVSGAGNVAQYCIEKLLQLNAKVVTASDSKGFIYDEEGFDMEKLSVLMEIKNEKRGTIKDYAERYNSVEYYERDYDQDHNPLWSINADCAFPCATQNEINAKDAQNLMDNNVFLISEGANMPSTNDAIDIFHDHDVMYAPGKASNAGGVAVSGLEMSQNRIRMGWSRKEVDVKLRNIMKEIHDTCLHYAKEYDMEGNYLAGANIAGFTKVAEAMLDQGVV
jgi:glutamate dehydrogenase (NADP+)